MQKMYSLEDAKGFVSSGAILKIAGDEKLLRQLPKGNWVGGTIPYFMGDNGGEMTRDAVYIEEAPPIVNDIRILSYTADEIFNFPKDGFAGGYSYIVIPGFSDVHFEYALSAIKIPGIFNRPVVGWVTGVHADEIGKISPKVFNGQTGECFSDRAVVMHTNFRDNKTAIVDIINLFKKDNGDEIVFEKDGFDVEYALVNGERVNFSEYINKTNNDLSLPIITSFNGAVITNSFRNMDLLKGTVTFFAPVYKGIVYNRAIPIQDYETEFLEHVKGKGSYQSVFSCNCLHNYLYANLEGKKSGEFKGPITFGEIAYILLNRTLVYLSII